MYRAWRDKYKSHQRSRETQEKLEILRDQFMKTWHHPSIATMEDDDSIELHAFDCTIPVPIKQGCWQV